MNSKRKIIKFSEREWQAVCKRAEFLKLRTGTYIRKIAVQEILKSYDSKISNRLQISFCRIGTLIEQILKISEQEQLPYTEEIKKMMKLYNERKINFENYLSELRPEKLL